MKTIIIEDLGVKTIITSLFTSDSTVFCDVTLKDRVPTVRIRTLHGSKNNTVDLSEEAIDFLKRLFL